MTPTIITYDRPLLVLGTVQIFPSDRPLWLKTMHIRLVLFEMTRWKIRICTPLSFEYFQIRSSKISQLITDFQISQKRKKSQNLAIGPIKQIMTGFKKAYDNSLYSQIRNFKKGACKNTFVPLVQKEIFFRKSTTLANPKSWDNQIHIPRHPSISHWDAAISPRRKKLSRKFTFTDFEVVVTSFTSKEFFCLSHVGDTPI